MLEAAVREPVRAAQKRTSYASPHDVEIVRFIRLNKLAAWVSYAGSATESGHPQSDVGRQSSEHAPDTATLVMHRHGKPAHHCGTGNPARSHRHNEPCTPLDVHGVAATGGPIGRGRSADRCLPAAAISLHLAGFQPVSSPDAPRLQPLPGA